ncbi:MAG: lipoprotein [Burkholderiales bacterium]
MRTLSLIFALAATLALTACGYKTPLALPKPKPDTVTPAPTPAATPDSNKPASK